MDVRGRTAARRHDGFPQGVLAVRALAGRQEAVNVAYDGHGAALGRGVDDGIAEAEPAEHLLLFDVLLAGQGVTDAGGEGFIKGHSSVFLVNT
jgi:hypothetical protein